MTGYTKLFKSILTSSVWCGQDSETKVVWITMLAMADKNGMVEATAPGLAKMAGVSLEKVEQVLDMLSGLDPVSRSLDNDSRRITRVNGGYTLVNYKRYRNRRDFDARKDYMRNYMRDYMRERRKTKKLNHPLNSVKLGLAQAEAYTYTIPPIIPPSKLDSVNNFSKNQNPKTPENHPRPCMMPGCQGTARAGLPGYAKLFCSEICYEHAKRLAPENIK